MTLKIVGFKTRTNDMHDWQYTNQFFLEGRNHYDSGGSIKDCPYNYLTVDQSNEKLVQSEHYREREWYAGFHQAFLDSLEAKKIA